MKSHKLVGMALALAILALVSAAPQDVQAKPTKMQTSSKVAIHTSSGASGSEDGPGDGPRVETLNGDPEDWLGGQNLKPLEPKPGPPEPTASLFDQFGLMWKSFIRSLEELAR